MNDTFRPDASSLLARLGIAADNLGACLGPDSGAAAERKSPRRIRRPAARLRACVLPTPPMSTRCSLPPRRPRTAWRDVPAPKRGEAVRRFGALLREHKDALGTLVALENGKIKAEGDGEVQEMIDIADFAVGQSRMLYGRTIASERPQHRMMEQWHPLGVVGVISAFNFPVAVWAWNAMLAAVCGNATVWKPSPKTPLTALAVQHLANSVMTDLALPPIFLLAICGNDETHALVADPRVALVSFTGSSAVGRDDRDDGRRTLRQMPARMRRQQRGRSWRRTPISISSCRRCCSAPSARPGSAARRRGVSSSTRAASPRSPHGLKTAYAQVKIGDPLDPDTLDGTVDRRDGGGRTSVAPSPRPSPRAARSSAAATFAPARDSGSSRRSSRTRATIGRWSSARRSRRSST